MRKLYLVLLLLVLSLFSVVFGIGFHTAEEILPGTFSSGNYVFDGKVGIGTNSPVEKLTVAGSIRIADYGSFSTMSNNTGIVIHGGNDSVGNPKGSGIIFRGYTGGVGGTASEGLEFYAGGSEVMRVMNNARIGIQTTNPSYRLQVGQTSNYGYVDATGAWQSSSDIRFKENIQNIDNALNKINQISGIRYNTLNNSKEQIGFSAQEVESVLPEIVSTDESGFKGVAYAKITPVLVNAIKELNQENQNLKQELCLKDNSYSWC